MSIFSQIMAGEIPANWVYQDELCVAFMDINPMSPGHVLVVPRLEVATLEELPGDLRTHLLDVTVRVAAAQRQGLGSLAQHVLVNDGKAASQTVPHVHFHVIPRYGRDQIATMSRIIWHVATLMLPPSVSASKRARLASQAEQIKQAMS
ncbi:MAG: HIT family protein [Moraxellaceae bacterium]|nr:HIT family protein [Moraxellaceae bacterium]MDZ4387612.1 HIT family protein [Moraxellaceae bacterium]